MNKEDLLQVLLETKDDKIELLNTINTTILSVVGVLAAVILSVIGLSYRSLGKKVKEAEKLITDLNLATTRIKEDQEKIDKILDTQDFKDKLEYFESNFKKIEISVNRWVDYEQSLKESIKEWEKQQATNAKNLIIGELERYLYFLRINNFVVRLNDEERSYLEQVLQNKLIFNSLEDKILNDYVIKLSQIFTKYRTPDDLTPV